jgi:putative Mn2+ efflux pump MntP
MDAFAVSVSSGMSHKLSVRKALIIAAYFGGFQALMPLIGWAVGFSFQGYIKTVDHWIAFILLGFIGAKMLYEVITEKKEEPSDLERLASKKVLSHKVLLLMAIATSIDALVVGVSFAFLKVDIFLSVLLIGVITFVISAAGVLIGKKFGDLLGKGAEILGGIVLIGIGLKILLEHIMG